MEDKKIKFGDLSWALKTSVIVSWAVGILYVIYFIIGFVTAILNGV